MLFQLVANAGAAMEIIVIKIWTWSVLLLKVGVAAIIAYFLVKYGKQLWDTFVQYQRRRGYENRIRTCIKNEAEKVFYRLWEYNNHLSDEDLIGHLTWKRVNESLHRTRGNLEALRITPIDHNIHSPRIVWDIYTCWISGIQTHLAKYTEHRTVPEHDPRSVIIEVILISENIDLYQRELEGLTEKNPALQQSIA